MTAEKYLLRGGENVKIRILKPKDIGDVLFDGCTVGIGGAGAGHAVPDLILKSMGAHFVKTGHPRDLTLFNPCGLGDNDSKGLNHLAIEGLVKRGIGGFWGNAPKMVKLALEYLDLTAIP